MTRRFKEARLRKGIKLTDCAEKLGVTQPTLSNWENGSKNPTLENLEAMADLYNVTTDFLLGRECFDLKSSTAVTKEMLPALHGKPVWHFSLEWCIVDAVNGQLYNLKGSYPILDEINSLRLSAKLIAQSQTSVQPIARDELYEYDEIVVEPISTDKKVINELRGYYRVKNGYVENSMGNRFFFDTYGFQWLAYKK